ncbi:MAG: hormogonium polysaccharide biosynthesis glycosyltransferase HpsE [Cyanobacteriota bacterium]|nr:hormogonium polysaccharide biosynthesis glycosyltransferase HpsE [Cyanobacteriota bacterium]
MEVSIDFTVAIPTYNGGDRLPAVLEKLQAQIKTEKIAWEIIIIDNNSSDNTARVIEDLQKNWHSPFPLKYYFEPKQGLAFARGRAIAEAKGDLVGFIDDDNLPAPDWVFEAFQFGKNYPKAGAYGGQIHAQFEVQPPENFDNIIGFLAIRERGDKPNLYKPEVLSLPPGAGLVVRKQVWCDCVPDTPILSGRSGNSLTSGSDWEPLIHMHKQGWEIWYNPAMHLDHLIPAERLEREYLLKLIRGSCSCFIPLKMTLAKPWQKPTIIARTLLGNSYKAIRYFIQNRKRLKQDIVAKCEMEIYLSRIYSVFFYINSSHQKKIK